MTLYFVIRNIRTFLVYGYYLGRYILINCNVLLIKMTVLVYTALLCILICSVNSHCCQARFKQCVMAKNIQLVGKKSTYVLECYTSPPLKIAAINQGAKNLPEVTDAL